MDNMTVLQVGSKNWADDVSELEEFQVYSWAYIDSKNWTTKSVKKALSMMKLGAFDTVLFTDVVEKELFEKIKKKIEAYTLIIDKRIKDDVNIQAIIREKCPVFMNFEDKKRILIQINMDFYSNQFIPKLHTSDINVNSDFFGSVVFNGESGMTFNGDYSSTDGNMLMTWQENAVMLNRAKKLRLEYKHSKGVEISLHIAELYDGTSEIKRVKIYTEKEIDEGIIVEYDGEIGYLAISLFAKGAGDLNVGPLHSTIYRHGHGGFLNGSTSYVAKGGEEFSFYFNPGDLKPPLTVYFGGWHSAEYFEGRYVMKSTGAPFLLISDARIGGGAFYLGSDELESSIVNKVDECLDYLGFSNKELILTGMSMGAYGSLYYTSKLDPKYVVVSKPVLSFGTIVHNEKIVRPNGFSPSFDVVKLIEGSLNEKSIDQLNDRFWNEFKKSKHSGTEFVITYMKNDDFDIDAYPMLLEEVSKYDGKIVGKGVLGRHNDASSITTEWFRAQIRRIMEQGFGRH